MVGRSYRGFFIRLTFALSGLAGNATVDDGGGAGGGSRRGIVVGASCHGHLQVLLQANPHH